MKKIKYLIEFFFIIIFFLIFKLLGYKIASIFGSFLLSILGPLFRSKKIIKNNIQISLDLSDENEISKIINNMWSNYGKILSDYIFIKNFRSGKLQKYLDIEGYEILEKIERNKKPVIFVSGHFNNFELMAMQIEKAGIKTAAIYRPLNNFFLNPLMEYLRMKYICPTQIPKGRAGMREIINRIKAGYSVALMMDQRVSEGQKVSFFNRPAFTTTIPAQLALKYDCELVPIFLERKENISFEMTIHEPYKIEKTGNDNEDTTNIILKINQIIEKMILKNPKQWIWSHNRWK